MQLRTVGGLTTDLQHWPLLIFDPFGRVNHGFTSLPLLSTQTILALHNPNPASAVFVFAIIKVEVTISIPAITKVLDELIMVIFLGLQEKLVIRIWLLGTAFWFPKIDFLLHHYRRIDDG